MYDKRTSAQRKETNFKLYTAVSRAQVHVDLTRRKERQLGPADNVFGVVVCNETGTVLLNKNVEAASSNVCELSAIKEALLFAQGVVGLQKIDVYSSSLVAVTWSRGRVGKHLLDGAAVIDLVSAIRRLCDRTVLPTITWVPSDLNVACHI
jgi:ribonuclease HI